MNTVDNCKNTILVVDDTPANLEIAMELLSSAGYTVWTATSGKQALKMLQTNRPALILLDVQMPQMDGFETCQQIKNNVETAHIPIIFLTVFLDTEKITTGFSLGAVDYITKPFLEAELLARVRTHLQLHHQNLEQQILERTTKLKDLETHQRKLFETSPIGLALCRMDGSLVDVNAAYATIIGHTVPETLTLSSWDITPETYAEDERLQLKSMEETGRYGPYEKEYIHKDGHLVPVRLSGLIVEQDGEKFIWSSVEDISDRKATEKSLNQTQFVVDKAALAQLQRTNEELMRATRLKDEFLAQMSNEFRTSLNPILGLSEALQEEVFGPLTEKQLKCLKAIERSGDHLLYLINDILDIFKIESGQVELNLKVTNIRRLCESSLTFVKQQAIKKSISLKTTIPPHPLSLLIDERRILHSLGKLLNNAVKFTPEGGCVTLEISCHSQDKNAQTLDSQELSEEVKNPNQLVWESGLLTAKNYIKISVRDTGIGIAPEQITRLFKPFSKIYSALNLKYNGSALGLVLVKHITELHGGTVSLISEVGVGSCFSINLPYNPDSSLSNPESLSDDINQPSSPSSAQPKDSPLILLAEDNENNINTIVSYLKARGYRLIVAKNELDAIQLAQTHHPDLILIDIQMPELDGLKAIERIRQDSNLQPIPIITLTALAIPGDQERYLAAGANLYLSKPIKLKQLVSSIQRLLDQ